MDLSTVVRFYVERMLKEVPGMKVLLLDADTTKIVSTVYSQSEILEQEVYLVERLDADRRDQLFHLKARDLGVSMCPFVFHNAQTCTKSLPCCMRSPVLNPLCLVQAACLGDIRATSKLCYIMLSAGSLLPETNKGKYSTHTARAKRPMLWAIQLV